ncbi:SKIP interacting protein 16 [Rhynchospora pubera]|uniref:SKIP interacting protein 16 n=1 Tax=Rhynchospora pubera TaxID=906938 RepID=A0AAV8E308_9POAL|nr:SKIP interacting protein 16 [Rhynchospora pubera]
MDLDPETEKYLRESIESLVGLEVSPKNLQLKLLASEDERRRLTAQVFFLEDSVYEASRLLEQFKMGSKKKAQALKLCIAAKAVITSCSHQLSALCDDLEIECFTFDRDLQRYMDALEQNKKENDELQAISQQDYPSEAAKLLAENIALEKEKTCLRLNITEAEKEFALLSEMNKALKEKNNRLNASIRISKKKNRTGGPPTVSKLSSYVYFSSSYA